MEWEEAPLAGLDQSRDGGNGRRRRSKREGRGLRLHGRVPAGRRRPCRGRTGLFWERLLISVEGKQGEGGGEGSGSLSAVVRSGQVLECTRSSGEEAKQQQMAAATGRDGAATSTAGRRKRERERLS